MACAVCDGGPITARVVISFVRTWLPAIVVVGGLAVIVIGRDEIALEGGAGIIGAGLSIWLFNVLLRMSYSGERDRHDEADARAFFDRHGVWPDEASDELLRRDARRRRQQP
ncbi:hypothetical protein GKE82_16265 [Conexibacter sp. W3-3-2]|uniref:Uncharacterized protein n=1 Tax=Paraconexibacter algicola TaxID=2133960 RepID=A0A2T4UJP6_9ACTN|nr:MULTISPECIES: hypothetical protein [Solirubrobacterales]MTD45802.1 hypothetical protein [Conexibacter sp. W3-3-2]PTL59463.1 hypothetical protein C7Y72_07270 [Paraconexibacter algicola]